MIKIDVREWEKRQLYDKLNELEDEYDSIDRQLQDANMVIDNLRTIKSECFAKIQSIKKVLRDKYGEVII